MRSVDLRVPLKDGPEVLRALRRQGLHELGDVLEGELVAASLVTPDYVPAVEMMLTDVRAETSFDSPVRLPGPTYVRVEVKVLGMGNALYHHLCDHVGKTFLPVFRR